MNNLIARSLKHFNGFFVNFFVGGFYNTFECKKTVLCLTWSFWEQSRNNEVLQAPCKDFDFFFLHNVWAFKIRFTHIERDPLYFRLKIVDIWFNRNKFANSPLSSIRSIHDWSRIFLMLQSPTLRGNHKAFQKTLFPDKQQHLVINIHCNPKSTRSSKSN